MPAELGALVFPILCEEGRCVFPADPNVAPAPVEWDPGEPWSFHLALEPADRGEIAGGNSAEPGRGAFPLAGWFRRGTARVPATRPQLITGDFLVIDHRVSRVSADDMWPWVTFLLRERQPVVPAAHVDRFVELLFTLPDLPPVEFPESLGVTIEAVAPVCCLKLAAASRSAAKAIAARLSFDYGGTEVPAGSSGAVVYRPEGRRGLRRDIRQERAAAASLKGHGFTELVTWSWSGSEEAGRLTIEPSRVRAAVSS